MDDGDQGDFRVIFNSSHLTQFTQRDSIVAGKFYRFRYRVSNVNGWSDYSSIAAIQATQPPAQPEMPSFISATDDSIEVGIPVFQNLGGTDVETFKLFIRDVETSTETELQNYDGSSSYTVTQATDAVFSTPGTFY